MEIHYSKHHATYVNKLNELLRDLESLLKTLDRVPASLRQAVRNNAGGHANHSFFWLLLKKPETCTPYPGASILEALEKSFGNYENFLKLFKGVAMGRFGSGWAWLSLEPSTKKLEVLSTANQDSPLMEGKIPLLGIDVWEHAYYLKHQNRRAEWLEDFFKVLNWQQVEENYKLASQI
ncbi:UNVERIFIED_CONTAM: hypothetical protein PYX00_010937 [Menopon gallinae]|uniref:Superoxide dismutase n=1 Tax=Menopon gallinae TaxID=328185 RepID=A0AAW2H705_9NEOP